VFLGTHTPRLDDKGRLFLPAKFREELAGGVVITRGQERCLYVFTRTAFAAKAEELQSASLGSKAARDYGRMFFSSASDEIPDKTGRVTLPQPLRQYAGLRTDALVIGASRNLEIWDPTRWHTRLAQVEGSIGESLATLGI
jgi:MraZ protein